MAELLLFLGIASLVSCVVMSSKSRGRTRDRMAAFWSRLEHGTALARGSLVFSFYILGAMSYTLFLVHLLDTHIPTYIYYFDYRVHGAVYSRERRDMVPRISQSSPWLRLFLFRRLSGMRGCNIRGLVRTATHLGSFPLRGQLRICR